MLNSARCAGLITLCVTVFPPMPEFDVQAMNDMTTKALGYPIYEYWNFFLPPEGPKLIDERLESFWYVMHGDQEDWMKKIWCTPGGE